MAQVDIVERFPKRTLIPTSIYYLIAAIGLDTDEDRSKSGVENGCPGDE